MKRKTLLLALPVLLAAGCFLEITSGFPRESTNRDDFEVFLSPNKSVISVGQNPPPFYVVLRNRSQKPQRLFEFWNSWGYQNISFYFYTDANISVATKKGQDFTRNFPSTYEIPPGETMVFPIKLDDSWEGLPSFPEGESKIRMRIVYTTNPSFEAKEKGAWVGIEASKIYEQGIWRIPQTASGQDQAK